MVAKKPNCDDTLVQRCFNAGPKVMIQATIESTLFQYVFITMLPLKSYIPYIFIIRD